MVGVSTKSKDCRECVHRWTGKLRVRPSVRRLCYKRAKGYLHIWLTAFALTITMARLCWLIAIGLSLAILIPLAVPLKLRNGVNQSLNPRPDLESDEQRIETKGTEGTVNSSKIAIESLKSGEGDLIAQFSQNLTAIQDLNKDQEKTLNGHNLDSSDTSARIGEKALKQALKLNSIESEIESKFTDFSEKERKLRNKSLFVSIAQNMKQTNYSNNLNDANVGSRASSTSIANKINPVPTAPTVPTVPIPDSLDWAPAPGPKSISISRESNGHRVREVVSGIGIQALGRTTQASLSRGPVVSVKHEMESQEQRRSELRAVTAGTPNRKFGENSLDSTLNIISNGIYWSKQLESRTPKGFAPIDDIRWSHLINSSSVVQMVEGCGRMQNRLITLDDGQRSCARHRQNNDQIQGDIFSFYLARVLGISNLPPATIAVAKAPVSDRNDTRWQKVRTQLHLWHWYNKPVVLTQYVDDLVPAFIPQLLRSDNRRLHPVPEDIGALNLTELTELVQWSDLIVFDYLTANLDRIVNNMINEKWNSEMMANPAHNLLKVRNTGLLLFIDNESGLLHGYRLLKKYERQHLSLLSALCVFRERTALLIEQLHKNKNIIYLIKSLFRQNVLDDEAYKSLPFLPEHNIRILYERISRVYRQINYCKSLYNNNKNNDKF